VECGHQSAEAGAVNITDLRQIQHDLFLAGGEQALHLFTKRIALFAQHDAPFDLQHRHAIHFVINHSQCHVRASWKIRNRIWNR
jgi:hypothetical protein